MFDFEFDSYFDYENEVITYPLETMDDVIRLDIMQMLVNKVKFKPCKCCGHYFIPGGRVNSEYCDRIMPGETKPCNEIGALKTFDIVHKNDDIHKAYITAYRRMDSRQRAKLITKDEFKESSANSPVQNAKNAITAKSHLYSFKHGLMILDKYVAKQQIVVCCFCVI